MHGAAKSMKDFSKIKGFLFINHMRRSVSFQTNLFIGRPIDSIGSMVDALDYI